MAARETESGHYHLHVHTISKLKGYAIQAAAAYRRAERFTAAPDETQTSITQAAAYRRAQNLGTDGRVFDYRRKMGVAWTGIIAPEFTPKELLDPQTLWNTVERIENRKNARMAREMIIALPHQVGLEVQVAMLRAFVTSQLVARGMVADIAIHMPPVEHGGDPRNWHAHVLLTDRPMTPNGFAAKKDRTWNAKENVTLWRKAWADVHNATMEHLGLPYRISHLSLAAQRQEALARGDVLNALDLDREPQIHVGKAHHATHPKHSIYADRRRTNEAILTRNKDGAALRADRWRGEIARADRAAHDEARKHAFLKDSWAVWDAEPLSDVELKALYGRPEPKSRLGQWRAAILRQEAARQAIALSRAHNHPWRVNGNAPDAPLLSDLLRPMVAKTGPGHPVFTVTAKDIVFAFYGMGLIGRPQLQASLENIAVEEDRVRAARGDKLPPPPPRPQKKPPTPRADYLAKLRKDAHAPEQVYLNRLEQLAAFERRHAMRTMAARRSAGRSRRRQLLHNGNA